MMICIFDNHLHGSISKIPVVLHKVNMSGEQVRVCCQNKKPPCVLQGGFLFMKT